MQQHQRSAHFTSVKTCTRCQFAKKRTEFSARRRSKDGLQSWCKLCVGEVNRDYYSRTPEKNPDRLATALRRRDIARDWLVEYLSTHPCVDCNNDDIRVLDFDHVRGKKRAAVSALAARGHSLDTIKTEVEKCEVRCANCHRIKTGERAGWWWTRPGVRSSTAVVRKVDLPGHPE